MPTISPKTTILLSARAGLWRNALESFLKAIPELDVCSQASDIAAMRRLLDSYRPEILLLEADLCGDQLDQALDSLQRDYPHLKVIVIADTPGQNQAAGKAGASLVLMKSMLHNQLHHALLPHPRTEAAPRI